jgi:hypothetical protein
MERMEEASNALDLWYPECKQSSATEGHACSLAQAMKSKDNSQHILKMNEVKVTSNSSILDLES